MAAVTHFGVFRHDERQRRHLAGEDVVVSVDQRDLHLVLAGRQPGDVDCVAVAWVRPPPGQVIDGYMQVPDTWRYLKGARPEHGRDAQVLHPVLGPEDAMGQRIGEVFDAEMEPKPATVTEAK